MASLFILEILILNKIHQEFLLQPQVFLFTSMKPQKIIKEVMA